MSKINQAAAVRIVTSLINGPSLLEIFKGIEAQMETLQSPGSFVAFQFLGDESELKDGDLIPEINFSLRRYEAPSVQLDGE